MMQRIRHNKKGGGRSGAPGRGRMDRLQFYLEPSLHHELERLAAECNVSKAELIRDGVRKVVEEYEQVKEDPIMKIVGQGSSGHTDVSEKHDDYIYRP